MLCRPVAITKHVRAFADACKYSAMASTRKGGHHRHLERCDLGRIHEPVDAEPVDALHQAITPSRGPCSDGALNWMKCKPLVGCHHAWCNHFAADIFSRHSLACPSRDSIQHTPQRLLSLSNRTEMDLQTEM